MSERICPLCLHVRSDWVQTPEGLVVCRECAAIVAVPKSPSLLHQIGQGVCTVMATLGILALLMGLSSGSGLTSLCGLLLFFGGLTSTLLIEIVGLLRTLRR
jgi:hypothetical protein